MTCEPIPMKWDVRIDTEGVIGRVTDLFRGHDDLILGFNQFLPPGYRIELPGSHVSPNAGGDNTAVPPASQQPLTTSAAPAQSSSAVGGMNTTTMPSSAPSNVAPGPTTAPAGSRAPSTNTAPMPSAAGAPKPTHEFNHAVNYVAKIKKRFEHMPGVYEQFLEILHTYQERKASEGSIERVKDQIHTLFRGHPDLLDDFKYFLPEGTSMKRTSKKKKKTASVERVSAVMV